MSRFSDGTVGRALPKSVTKCRRRKKNQKSKNCIKMLLLGCCCCCCCWCGLCCCWCSSFWCDILVRRMPYFISIAKSVMLQRFMCAVSTDDDAAAAFWAMFRCRLLSVCVCLCVCSRPKCCHVWWRRENCTHTHTNAERDRYLYINKNALSTNSNAR